MSALNDDFELLNADDEFPPNVTKDAIMLYDSLEFDGENKVTGTQLWNFLRQLFQDLAFEDALTYSGPRNWTNSIPVIDETQQNTKKYIA